MIKKERGSIKILKHTSRGSKCNTPVFSDTLDFLYPVFRLVESNKSNFTLTKVLIYTNYSYTIKTKNYPRK
jgi:hypothetical protein